MPFQPLREPEAIHADLKPARIEGKEADKRLIVSKQGAGPIGIVVLTDVEDHGHNVRIHIAPLPGCVIPEDTETEVLRLMLTVAFEKLKMRNVYMTITPTASTQRARLEAIGFIYGATYKGSVIMDCIKPAITEGRD